MPKGYWVTWYHSIGEPSSHERYAEAATAAIGVFGGRFLTRGLPVASFEGQQLQGQRCVVVEFESVAAAIAAYDSPAYQAALCLLGSAAVREVRILEGNAESGPSQSQAQ